MAIVRRILPLAACAGLLTIPVAPGVAVAQSRHYSANSDEAHGPQKLVDKAASVAMSMERDPHLRSLMRRAAGLFIIPEYGRAGFIFGGKGGAGVVVARTRGGWSSPAFFDTGGINFGLQIGAAGGAVAYLLMTPRALNAFRSHNKLSLDAHAGYSIVKYSDAAETSSNPGDAIIWTNINGAYAGAVVGATDVGVNGDRMRDFYGRDVGVNATLNGEVRAPGARALDGVLP